MKAKNIEKSLLIQNNIDASVNFQNNGNIYVTPCSWADDKQVTHGETVFYRGGVMVEPNGKTLVKRYNEGSNGPKYNLVFETPHGKVFASKKWKTGNRPSRRKVIVRFEFPKKYPLDLIRKLYKEESQEVMAFFKTRKEETIWE